MIFKNLLFVLLILLIIGCVPNNGTITGKVTTKNTLIPEESSKDPQAFFCRETSCEDIYISLMNSASNYVHCAFFEFNLMDLSDTVNERRNDIDIKLVIDSDNYMHQFPDDMVTVDTEKQFSHNKFCVFDGTTVITGSFNPTVNEETKNDNNIVVLYSQYLADNYEKEFQELFSGVFGGGEKTKITKVNINNRLIENYFCPEDHCEKEIVEELLAAKESIYFMAFSFTSDAIADALLISDARDIKGVVENRGAKSKYGQFLRLKDYGINVKTDSNPATMHHKVFIIDNSTVITGSMNPTSAGNSKNDENILIIHDPKIAEKYVKEFERVYAYNKN